jgi:hypothetical protein
MTTHRKNTYPAAEATTGGGYIYSDTHSRKNTEGGGGYREREHPRMSGKLSETATAGSLGGGGRGEYGSNDHQQGPSLETVFTLHIANLCLAIPPVVCLSGATLDIRQILRPMKIARDLGFELNGLTKHVRGIIDSA